MQTQMYFQSMSGPSMRTQGLSSARWTLLEVLTIIEGGSFNDFPWHAQIPHATITFSSRFG
jgi:hypothetical protein